MEWRETVWARWSVLVFGLIAYLLGIRSLVYFIGFVSNVSFVENVNSVPAQDWRYALAVDIALLLAFALPHSLLARTRFKQAFVRRFPEASLRSSYVLIAALMLMLLMWRWEPIGRVIWDVGSGFARSLVAGIGVAGWVLAAISYYSIGHLELFGLRQAWWFWRGVPFVPGGLVVNGVYRYLRDPMFLGFFVGMWATPRMTAGHFLLAAGMTVYLLIGMRYEKRDLIAKFGDRYLAYLRTRLPARKHD